ncbi:putative CALMODULIN-BINDING PROTEIN60 [Helianthus anomalus]
MKLYTSNRNIGGSRYTPGHLLTYVPANTGHVVTSGPKSSTKLYDVVLEGDLKNEDDEGWTGEEFKSHAAKEREGKKLLLNGDLQVVLNEGVGTLGELTFTDNSSWIRSRKFRLGLKVASGFCEDIRVREEKEGFLF